MEGHPQISDYRPHKTVFALCLCCSGYWTTLAGMEPFHLFGTGSILMTDLFKSHQVSSHKNGIGLVLIMQ
jgi:hypothetical protein